MSAGLLVAFALAGALGAAARYTLDIVITARVRAVSWGWGTMTVNLTGSFAVGLLAGLALQHDLPEGLRVVLGSGFLGAYTTFSTWMYELARLLDRGQWRAAYLGAVLSPLLGVLLSALGFFLVG